MPARKRCRHIHHHPNQTEKIREKKAQERPIASFAHPSPDLPAQKFVFTNDRKKRKKIEEEYFSARYISGGRQRSSSSQLTQQPGPPESSPFDPSHPSTPHECLEFPHSNFLLSFLPTPSPPPSAGTPPLPKLPRLILSLLRISRMRCAPAGAPMVRSPCP